MKGRRLCLCVFALGMIVSTIPNYAFADLVSVPTDGTIVLGPANTLVTIHHGGNGNGPESGCIGPDGSVASCLNTATTHVAGGDNVGLNQILDYSTNLNFAAVVTAKEPGDIFNGSLTDLYLRFTGLNGNYTVEYAGPDVLLATGPAMFTLSGTDFAAIQSLGDQVTISGGFGIEGQYKSGGPEALHVVQLSERTNDTSIAAVPEPTTVLLLGTGLVLTGVMRRK